MKLFETAMLVSALSLSTALVAEPQHFNSGPEAVQLVELYTSQGCSSCPPADALLSSLTHHEDLWHKVIPIAFHVDYWNYLGWRDIFSSPEMTHRQYQHRRNNNIKSVYTPGFVVNGSEWRGYFRRQGFPEPLTTKAGNLAVTWQNNRALLSFDNQQARIPAQCHAAIVGLNQVVDIKAGENRGLTLQHDFTALNLASAQVNTKNHHYTCEVALGHADELASAESYALIAWLSDRNMRPIQASGGPLKLN
ncbi:MAG: DUF1223 domain-containing protein [Pseudomonadales bacterium]